MAIGERIHHFRLLRGFTQKYLGQQLGFSDSQADVRIAQYEKGARSPKEKYLNALADIFEVSPHALAVPDIDSWKALHPAQNRRHQQSGGGQDPHPLPDGRHGGPPGAGCPGLTIPTFYSTTGV